ncbi:glycoside hydrolase family 71/99-like protein [Chondrinema litorale]|uniref:glycoside hydrolase family 71/99-like protein n=1 Tax=Chondrinema litorale TaxID=2994555 RepID=UPI0025436ED3|nr:glycoside hydrolase family 71/99-like protein [Chondrinema litorale]UZR97445.1 glycoside hydrolase family 71/99-like protein [Chondrinema litorale]
MKIKNTFLSTFILSLIVLNFNSIRAQESVKLKKFKKHTLSAGLVMAGYQGWFDAPGDGSDRGWYHYERKGRFEPGYCTIDVWPEMSEYEKQYETAFKFEDGTPATVFSPHDESTVNLHFKWMKDYHIDGVFMQRFVVEVKSELGKKHFNKVLHSASKAATEHDRTIAIMYDMSGMQSADIDLVMKDWKEIITEYGFDKRSRYKNYLFNDDRPVIALWGVGFNDGRKYNLKDVEKLIQFFKSDEAGNCSVLLGVPTYWREQGRDCVKDDNFLDIVKQADIVHPWFVGRFNENGYPNFKSIIGKDVKWCEENGLAYMPVVFPGFSWNNMLPPDKPSSTNPRNKGNFLWKQFSGAASEGAQMVYVAMFDEIDEGTAIFKLAHKVPVGKSKFIALEDDIPSDHYLWLTGKAADLLKRNKKLPTEKPLQAEK